MTEIISQAAPAPEPPMQPIVLVGNVGRFKANALVRHLLDHGGIDMNKLAMLYFEDADRRQFAQLIGYSVSGYGDLSYAEGHESGVQADAIAAALATPPISEQPAPDGAASLTERIRQFLYSKGWVVAVNRDFLCRDDGSEQSIRLDLIDALAAALAAKPKPVSAPTPTEKLKEAARRVLKGRSFREHGRYTGVDGIDYESDCEALAEFVAAIGAEPVSEQPAPAEVSALCQQRSADASGPVHCGDWNTFCEGCPQAPAEAGSAPMVLPEPTAAARDVLTERRRQVEKEGWTAEHDDQHEHDLALAAGAYAVVGTTDATPTEAPAWWPWDEEWWKPSTHRRNLVKAGALILAAIEKIDRATPLSPKQESRPETQLSAEEKALLEQVREAMSQVEAGNPLKDFLDPPDIEDALWLLLELEPR